MKYASSKSLYCYIYSEMFHRDVVILSTLAKSAITKASLGSVLSISIKDFLYAAITLGLMPFSLNQSNASLDDKVLSKG